ncbi:hypothetical protein ACVRY7_10580 [Streptococcus ictaluri]|uniref:Uncharacterized protein n=1 Tax=Streptococcus ictaluri 707-05 TaxID=764299 RepID=G5K4T6_9STRE|nr:hypothetical protein [Streptococcus ictaluri]EHI68799.1 hypothetical protein STRIC_1823 [Streptococcus ictaluri 707-05]
MNLELQKLGFVEVIYHGTGEMCFQKRTRGRFIHEFNIFPDGELIINFYKSSGSITISDDEVLCNRNLLHNEAKDLLLELRKIGYY